jgi:hypothetical protein
MRRTLVAVLASSMVFACSSARTDDDAAGGDEKDLIGGKETAAGELASTLNVLGNCTVSKVGPKLLLTAAHCVLDTQTRDVRADFKPGRKLTLRARAGAEFRSVSIDRTEIVPRALDACRRTYACLKTIDVAALSDVPDVAVVVLNEELIDIPTATVDIEAVKQGDPLTIVGYGCVTGVRSADHDGKLRAADVKAVPTEAVVHAGSYLSNRLAKTLEEVGGNYVITPGPKMAGDAGGLCPGDSGGPVYRKGTNVIVGVNASYSFEVGGDIPVTNWHTRLDAQARHGVAAWLESVGVSMSKPCAEAGCTAVNRDPCHGLDYTGKCSGSVIEWCQDGEYKKTDCTAKTDGRTQCGFDTANPANGLNCIIPTDPCHGFDYNGTCTGTVVEWCDRGAYKRVDCATKTDGRTICGADINPAIGFNCVAR